MAGLWGHGAEGVCAAGGEGVNADEQHVHQQGPGVAVGQEVQSGAEGEETPQEVPANHHFVLIQHVYNPLGSKVFLSDVYCPTIFKVAVLLIEAYQTFFASTFSHFSENLISTSLFFLEHYEDFKGLQFSPHTSTNP